jgi:hypothetical protein
MSLADTRIAGQAVPGMKATRARSAAFTWNVGRLTLTLFPFGIGGCERERSKRLKLRGIEYRCGVGIRTDS